ncbi:VOC family protein [Paenibacillus athensensis]|uniref:VOC domain-containing protein n=1 Tax=Paenibacillus athensensis TaxID=1967502 RepID=A0A4Y8PSG0_9BACL|nr:VOC family protein [Paenibacillus athensensis]MCD1259444.1 VOC family protein [Paenibacillus athensensis]
MIAHMATVAIYVEDQQRAKAFWTEKVGFKLVSDIPLGAGMRWLEVAPQGAGTALVIYPKSRMSNWAELKPSIVFACSDIRLTYAQMKERGVEFEGEPRELEWGLYATFRDEDGNAFLLKEQV